MHQEALSRMHYAVTQKKLGILLIGAYGTGKTYLSMVLKQTLSEDKYRFIYIANPRITPLEFVRYIADDVGGNVEISRQQTKIDFLRLIRDGLEDYCNRGMYTVIVIDEAQSIRKDELLEEIRLLLNIQGEESTLFTLILLGQPQVEEKIDKVPQFKQRLPIRYKLFPMTEEEARNYIDHRLKVAGATQKIFTDSGYAEVYAFSGGMPRAINNICDLALLTGFIARRETIDKDIIVRIREDVSTSGAQDTG